MGVLIPLVLGVAVVDYVFELNILKDIKGAIFCRCKCNEKCSCCCKETE